MRDIRERVSKPACLTLLLALVAVCPTAFAAERTAPAQHDHSKRFRHRRARAEVALGGRAGRTGAPAGGKGDFAKTVPAERPESVGSPNDGHLKGGVHVDLARPYFRVVPSVESGDVRWGHPALVSMIDHAARTVAKRFPGSVLHVGDLSRKGGGDLLRHHSHESGRDADLGFYAVDGHGKQLHSQGFIKFDANLASPTTPGAHFDLPRNWAFIQELLTDPTARVSHVFIAEYLRQQLLTYARPRVSHPLFERAALVMMQPHHSLPHDDHIHVRISCPHDVRSGCIELAKNAPHGMGRVAHRGSSGTHVIKTPHVHPVPTHPMRPPVASATAPQDPFKLPPASLPQGPVADDAEPDFEVD